MTRLIALAAIFFVSFAACGSQDTPSPASSEAAEATPAPEPEPAVPSIPDTFPNGIMLALAQFVTEKGDDGKDKTVPGAARVEFLYRKDGSWQTSVLEDPESNVFHKVMVYDGADGPRLLTAGGTAAILKLWEKTPDGLVPTTIWQEDFGGKWSRMRETEVGDIYGDGSASIAVVTHDNGVVAIVRPSEGAFTVEKIDRQERTFVHEVEIGDLDGDGVLEVYATPSEPNKLDGSPQSGEVVRYIPSKGEGPVVVADLGDRHAKEILVADVDGDGRDELYVSVEGLVEGKGAAKRIKAPVEIRRYEADTPADGGAVIAVLQDSLNRFLTVGDIDGDGVKEMVATAFSSGVWLLRPGEDPSKEWLRELVDRDSAGFEHAAILADLDSDGRDELYVASDRHKEVRRYVWNGDRLEREVIYERPDDRPIFTWNLMPVPLELIP